MSTPTPEVKKATTPKLVQGRLKSAEFARNTYRAVPEASTSLKDLLEPTYWAHVAGKFGLYDTIEVVPEGGAWYAQLLVVGCSKLHAKVKVLMFVKLQAEADPADTAKSEAKFTVEFKGPQRKWSVIRASDKSYAKEGFDTKEGATEWLAANEADLLGLA